MAVQLNTKKVDKFIASESWINKIVDEIPKVNAKRLFDQFVILENKFSEIESGAHGIFVKITDKPFYYFTEGKYYIADPSRLQIPNDGAIPPYVSAVPTSVMSWDNYFILFKFHRNCPIFSDYDDNGWRLITNKDDAKYNSVLGLNSGYYFKFYINSF